MKEMEFRLTYRSAEQSVEVDKNLGRDFGRSSVD
jgi:hypothetical protein